MESKMYYILVNCSEMKLDMCFFWSDYSPPFIQLTCMANCFICVWVILKKNQQKALCIFLNILDNPSYTALFPTSLETSVLSFHAGTEKKKRPKIFFWGLFRLPGGLFWKEKWSFKNSFSQYAHRNSILMVEISSWRWNLKEIFSKLFN